MLKIDESLQLVKIKTWPYNILNIHVKLTLPLLKVELTNFSLHIRIL